jgi:hypothetical protein
MLMGPSHDVNILKANEYYITSFCIYAGKGQLLEMVLLIVPLSIGNKDFSPDFSPKLVEILQL